MSSFTLQHRRASALELIELGRRERPDGRLAVLQEVSDRAVVLGSTQSFDEVDQEAAAGRGLSIARRPSGGGAVLVAPGAQVWADFFLPAGDPLLESDLAASFQWLGRSWQKALSALGVGDLTVSGRAGEHHRLERRLCFVAVGAGEVLVRGKKVVGISQRRIREGAFFFSMLLLAETGEELVSCLRLGEEPADALDALAARSGWLPLQPGAVEEALLAALP